MNRDDQSSERRRYVRLETVFPIEFQIRSKEAGTSVSTLRQGFTRNVSEGGMCLEVNELDTGLVDSMRTPDSQLDIFIDLPHREEPITATAVVRWDKKINPVRGNASNGGFPNKYIFGIEYVQIGDGVRKEIIRYAKRLHRRPKLIAISVILLITACTGLMWQMHRLGIKKGITERQLLSLGQMLTKVHEERVSLENKIYAFNIKRQILEEDLKKGKDAIKLLEGRLSKMSVLGNRLSDELLTQRLNLEKELLQWKDERKELIRQLNELTISRDSLSSELVKLRDSGTEKIIKVHLINGSSIIGQLIDLTSDRIYVKIGLGSIGLERAMITNIKEVYGAERMDIQKEWQRQEEEARRDALEYKRFLEEQKEKGLVYFNGQWLKLEEAKAIEEAQKQREQEIFELIARQTTADSRSKPPLLETLLQSDERPLISIRDNRIYVNGQIFFIKGVGYGIEYPGTSGSMDTYKNTPIGIFEKDFQMMKEAGINTIRTYEPLPDKLLDMAEKYGIMVIENVCYPSDNTDFNSRVHLDVLKEQVRRYVSRDKNRRCILMWSIWNDAPWAWGAGGNVVERYGFSKVNNFLKELYDTVRQYDITHPVTAGNAIGLEGEKLGWDFLDIIGLNLYIGGFDWFIETQAQKNIAEVRSIEKEYNKPVLILETGFSTFVKGQDQAEILEKQIKTAGTNVCGITIFQWADGWQKAGDKNKQDEHIEEHWGILDGYRNPKPGYKTVCKLFNTIKTDSYGYSE